MSTHYRTRLEGFKREGIASLIGTSTVDVHQWFAGLTVAEHIPKDVVGVTAGQIGKRENDESICPLG